MRTLPCHLLVFYCIGTLVLTGGACGRRRAEEIDGVGGQEAKKVREYSASSFRRRCATARLLISPSQLLSDVGLSILHSIRSYECRPLHMFSCGFWLRWCPISRGPLQSSLVLSIFSKF